MWAMWMWWRQWLFLLWVWWQVCCLRCLWVIVSRVFIRLRQKMSNIRSRQQLHLKHLLIAVWWHWWRLWFRLLCSCGRIRCYWVRWLALRCLWHWVWYAGARRIRCLMMALKWWRWLALLWLLRKVLRKWWRQRVRLSHWCKPQQVCLQAIRVWLLLRCCLWVCW